MAENNTTVDAASVWDTDSGDVAQSLADDNLQAQGHLWEALRGALVASGLSYEDVASRLGIDVDLVRAISGGRVDISLSDLREYAYAVDASITYRVIPRYSHYLETFRQLLSEKHWHDSHSDNVQFDRRTLEALVP
ncbi:hypothetical protein [Pseudarthrobacter sp. BRE9]|uniref:helix-turn-helix domain-containing protein n=1 Tax=Pseudarthrobacter sp. BRE9 TaxID=2962582 RepID=UPI00288162D3|nr:hypothetical protein [Pseudarthrobacter sp. BRE9]MDT0169566.1 hypothetical protein [Pseudarthrobacter sp. BRE9]